MRSSSWLDHGRQEHRTWRFSLGAWCRPRHSSQPSAHLCSLEGEGNKLERHQKHARPQPCMWKREESVITHEARPYHLIGKPYHLQSQQQETWTTRKRFEKNSLRPGLDIACGTVLYCTVLDRTKRYQCTVVCRTVLYCNVLYCAVLCCAGPFCSLVSYYYMIFRIIMLYLTSGGNSMLRPDITFPPPTGEH